MKEILDINDITGENERVDENEMDEEIEFQSDGDEEEDFNVTSVSKEGEKNDVIVIDWVIYCYLFVYITC